MHYVIVLYKCLKFLAEKMATYYQRLTLGDTKPAKNGTQTAGHGFSVSVLIEGVHKTSRKARHAGVRAIGLGV